MKGTAEALGMKSVLSDLGFSVNLCLESDATAAIGIVKRQVLGAVRHLATADLWVQQRIKDKELRVSKVGTAENMADLLTKVLLADQTLYLLSKMGYFFVEGRSAIAPVRASGDSSHNDFGGEASYGLNCVSAMEGCLDVTPATDCLVFPSCQNSV